VIRGIKQLIKTVVGLVRGLIKAVKRLIGKVEDGIKMVRNLPNLGSDELARLAKDFPGLSKAQSATPAIIAADELRQVRDMLLAVAVYADATTEVTARRLPGASRLRSSLGQQLSRSRRTEASLSRS